MQRDYRKNADKRVLEQMIGANAERIVVAVAIIGALVMYIWDRL